MPVSYRNLAFTSPETETRIEFTFDGTMEDGKTHNLGEFQFAGVDEKYYQDKSLSSDSYGFNLLINDQDELREIRKALDEKISDDNPGTLEHPDPTLGTFPVATSSYKVNQNSVSGRGVISIQVIWFRTIPNLIGGDPSDSNNPASSTAVLKSVDQLNEEQATDFENSVDYSTGQGFARTVERAREAVVKAQQFLGSIAAQVDEINILFTNGVAEILSTADDLARAPFDLARQVQNLVQLPMLAIDSATDRIEAYKEYVNSVLQFSETDETEFSEGSVEGKDILSVAGMAALAGISAINYSAVSTKSLSLDEIKAEFSADQAGYLSRQQIIETIQAVQGTAFDTTEDLSQRAADFDASSFFTQYFDYSILNKNLITASVRNLNQRIFSTSREVVIRNEKEQHPAVLCSYLYNSISKNTIEFFISSNKLHGDDIYLVPKGREIIYYV